MTVVIIVLHYFGLHYIRHWSQHTGNPRNGGRGLANAVSKNTDSCSLDNSLIACLFQKCYIGVHGFKQPSKIRNQLDLTLANII